MKAFNFLICVICFLISVISVFAEDSLTITTYYPLPYGSFRELRSQRIAIGDNYIDGGQYCWEGACTNTINANADLVVEGNVGFGTPGPESPLHVRGNDGMITIEDNNSVAKFSIAAGSGNYFYIDEGVNRRLAIVGGDVGIGTPSPGAKLEVNGRIKAVASGINNDVGYAVINTDGRIGRWAVGPGYLIVNLDGIDYSIAIALSSEKFKKNIKDLEIDSSKLYNLRPVSFDWKDPARGKNRMMGLIAEEVNKYFPEAVLWDENGEIFSLNYDLLIVPMINEMKKLKAEVETLKTEKETTVAGLQAQINELKAASKN